jgi:hypothetical protein
VTFVRCSPILKEKAKQSKSKSQKKSNQTTNHQVRRRWTKVREEEEKG